MKERTILLTIILLIAVVGFLTVFPYSLAKSPSRYVTSQPPLTLTEPPRYFYYTPTTPRTITENIHVTVSVPDDRPLIVGTIVLVLALGLGFGYIMWGRKDRTRRVVEKIGFEGLVASIGFFLMAVSAFLSWVDVTSVSGQFHLTGLQVMGAQPGMLLLAFALLGGLTIWFLSSRRTPKRWIHDGLSDIIFGTGVLMLTISDMDHLRNVPIAASLRFDFGSGCYLAIVASLLVLGAGIVIESKSYLAHVNLGKPDSQREGLTSTKSKSGLHGSFSLNDQTINEEVDSGSAGVYALGYLRGKTFIIQHIGRSGTDVNARLKEYIGKYDRFKFDTSDSPHAAFTKECELYHAFGGPEGKIIHNKNHPDPAGMDWSCPLCIA